LPLRARSPNNADAQRTQLRQGRTDVNDAFSWDGNWAWALPLIVLTIVLHVVGLGLINTRMIHTLGPLRARRSFFVVFVLVMGAAALSATVLHGLEASIWAAAYSGLGAVPDGRAALLFSLNAITAYGHTDLNLAPHWRLMGALEALNGLLLFGLTTAFLYGHLQRVWPRERLPAHASAEHAPIRAAANADRGTA
jgi:hypothetical protein